MIGLLCALNPWLMHVDSMCTRPLDVMCMMMKKWDLLDLLELMIFLERHIIFSQFWLFIDTHLTWLHIPLPDSKVGGQRSKVSGPTFSPNLLAYEFLKSHSLLMKLCWYYLVWGAWKRGKNVKAFFWNITATKIELHIWLIMETTVILKKGGLCFSSIQFCEFPQVQCRFPNSLHRLTDQSEDRCTYVFISRPNAVYTCTCMCLLQPAED